jgi:hypothetical protein
MYESVEKTILSGESGLPFTVWLPAEDELQQLQQRLPIFNWSFKKSYS